MPRIGAATLNTRAYWDEMYQAGNYPSLDPNNIARYEAAIDQHRGETALDVGCGQCALGKLLLERHLNVKYTGWDFSRQAHQLHLLPNDERWTLYLGTWNSTAWARGRTWATVYLCEVLEHVSNPARLLRKLAPLASERLVVTVPIFGLLGLAEHHGEHAWDFEEGEIRELLGQYGNVLGPFLAGTICHTYAVEIEGAG